MKKHINLNAIANEQNQSENRFPAIELLRFLLEEFKRQSPEEYIELQTESEFDVNPVASSNGNITWLGDDNSLHTFYYHAVLKEELILVDSEDAFKSHFVGKVVPDEKMIINKRKINEVIYLFKEFCKRDVKLIAKDSYLHNLLPEHFTDEFGEDLKHGSLKTIVNRETCVRSEERVEVLNAIVAEVIRANKGRPDYSDE